MQALQKYLGKGKYTSNLPLENFYRWAMFHVPEMSKNLISSYIFSKVGTKMMFWSDKLVVTKGGNFIGQGYARNASLFIVLATCEVANCNSLLLISFVNYSADLNNTFN